MHSVLKKLALATAVAAAPLIAASGASDEGERYILVSHAPDSDFWWNTIKNGMALAGEQMNVEVEYRNPPTGDIADMARIIDQAAASRPDSTPRMTASRCSSVSIIRSSNPRWPSAARALQTDWVLDWGPRCSTAAPIRPRSRTAIWPIFRPIPTPMPS
ncbi:hypothetical protein DEA8626_01074 [Defluviimonas aquaemixtae]|uniref:Periplasmic binding protein domain-containing protein n=1 Tax=Albidovulum aquaemixtae TaxID=1542388 RepID=A0A2R8B4L3_9RHOB|nr:hypothetical protein DEA8626_01074 [Defluviimonas aquaemixtae]